MTPATLRVVGVDPGARWIGWAMLEGDASGARYLASGVLELEPGDAGLRALRRAAHELLAAHRPGVVVIERVAQVYTCARFGASRSTGLVHAAWTGGELAGLAASMGLAVRSIDHNAAKDRIGAHAGTGGDVAAALRARVAGWPHVVGDHERDAGSVALAVICEGGRHV